MVDQKEGRRERQVRVNAHCIVYAAHVESNSCRERQRICHIVEKADDVTLSQGSCHTLSSPTLFQVLWVRQVHILVQLCRK